MAFSFEFWKEIVEARTLSPASSSTLIISREYLMVAKHSGGSQENTA